MLNEPFTLADETIALALQTEYAITAVLREFLPLGHDNNAAVYRILASDGVEYFLKVRLGIFNQHSLLVPRMLLDAGITHVLAPIRTISGQITCSFAQYSAVLYPFIHGENAMDQAMTDQQWRVFGATLRVIHDSPMAAQFAETIPHETFGLISAQLIREVQRLVETQHYTDVYELAFVAFWREYWPQIEAHVAHAEALGRQLQQVPFEYVLCHSDIHAANILLGADGFLYLVDWDSPLLAPRERDLLFIIGSIIARRVSPREEQLFFEQYGDVPVNRVALGYYRYERAIEDIAVTGQAILIDHILKGEDITSEIALMRSFFAPDNMFDLARNA